MVSSIDVLIRSRNVALNTLSSYNVLLTDSGIGSSGAGVGREFILGEEVGKYCSEMTEVMATEGKEAICG